MVDEMMQQGAETVNQLHQQKDRLKGAQRKLMDVMNTLGLSNSLMGVIDRRQRMDRWIVYLGMAIMLAFLYLLYWWKFTYRVVGGLAEEDGGAEGADAPA